MNKFCYVAAVIILLSVAAVTLLGGCTMGETSRINVVTSTSLMEYIVRQVGGDRVEVVNLVPPNQHPGNFDVKPADIQKLASASLFLLHGWPGEGYADKLVSSANNPNLAVVKASVDGVEIALVPDTLVVPPDTSTVPLPEKAVPVFQLRVPPLISSVAPLATA